MIPEIPKPFPRTASFPDRPRACRGLALAGLVALAALQGGCTPKIEIFKGATLEPKATRMAQADALRCADFFSDLFGAATHSARYADRMPELPEAFLWGAPGSPASGVEVTREPSTGSRVVYRWRFLGQPDPDGATRTGDLLLSVDVPTRSGTLEAQGFRVRRPEGTWGLEGRIVVSAPGEALILSGGPGGPSEGLRLAWHPVGGGGSAGYDLRPVLTFRTPGAGQPRAMLHADVSLGADGTTPGPLPTRGTLLSLFLSTDTPSGGQALRFDASCLAPVEGRLALTSQDFQVRQTAVVGFGPPCGARVILP